jgi:TctA family transporter
MAPLLLALVLGDRLEESIRLALTLSGGDPWTFVNGATLTVLASALVLVLIVQAIVWSARPDTRP